MENRKRALYLTGQNQYGVLSEMVGRFADYLEKVKGYQICRYEYEELDQYLKVKNEEWDYILSAQGIEFNLFNTVDENVHVIWMVDHPIYHFPRFENYPRHDKVYIGCVDHTHVSYLKKHTEFKNSFFMPHFGWKVTEGKTYANRSCEVFFPASYSDIEKIKRDNEEWMQGALKTIVEQVIDRMLAEDQMTLEEGIASVIHSLGQPDETELTEEIEHTVGWYIDSYLRGYVREQVIRGLLQNHITVTVAGRAWENFRKKLSKAESDRLTVLSEDMPYEAIVHQMAESKIVLNILPWFKNGSHERVIMSTLHGAVCVTDRNCLLEEIYQENESIVFYDWKKPEQLAGQINALLANPSKAAQIAEAGRKITEEHFLVKNTVDAFERGISGREQNTN